MRIIKHTIWLSLLLGLWANGLAQDKYWIFFTDKGECEQFQPCEHLSPEALANREKQGIEPDWYDLPVANSYVHQIQELGIQPQRRTRWFNGLSSALTPEQLVQVQSLPFVKAVQPVGKYQVGIAATAEGEAIVHQPSANFLRQLEMMDLGKLHYAGLTGKGVLMAVFDSGFTGVDDLPAFRQIFDQNRIVATWDFVAKVADVFNSCTGCRHGNQVFSTIAAVMPGQLIGSAPGCDFLLFRTENTSSETPQEEDNWLAAAEFADSLGAQIFSTSLVYYDFDGEENDYRFSDYDGNTALITRAGDMAASRGILVVNAGGNRGTRGFNAPADGDSVIAIGSVDENETYSSFSTQGPTADGRIKPDLSAMGEQVFYLDVDGKIKQGNGTSFACPLVSGLAACLMQAFPEASSMEIYESMRATASQADAPDNLLGHGIPSGVLAWEWLAERYEPQSQPPEESGFSTSVAFPSSWVTYSNPAEGYVYLNVPLGGLPGSLDFEWVDLTGRVVAGEWEVPVAKQIALQTPGVGIFILRISGSEENELLHQEKIFVQESR